MEIIKLINISNKIDIDIHKFNKSTFLDDNFKLDNFWVLEENKDIIGTIYIGQHTEYIYKIDEEKNAYIQFFSIKPGHDNNNNIQLMYNKAIDKIDDFDILYYGMFSPSYLFPGISEHASSEKTFLKNNGFEEYEKNYSMSVSLSKLEYPDEIINKKQGLSKKGFTFDKLTADKLMELLSFVESEFSRGWFRNIKQSLRTVEDYEKIIIISKMNQIIGYVQSGFDGDEKRFGPFGISNKFRNQGLGTILIYEKLLYMKEKGIKTAYFMSTNEQGRRFYERIGFKLDVTYETLRFINNDDT